MFERTEEEKLSMIKGILTDEATNDRLARSIIGCAAALGNGRGTDFFKKMHENAPANRLRKNGRPAKPNQTRRTRPTSQKTSPKIPLIIDNNTFLPAAAANQTKGDKQAPDSPKQPAFTIR